MAALALVHEYSPLTQMQILEPQTEHFAAAQTTEDHRLHHRPITVGAQRAHQRGELFGFEDARQPANRTHQRLAPSLTSVPTRRKPTRHRIGLHTDITAGDQIAVE